MKNISVFFLSSLIWASISACTSATTSKSNNDNDQSNTNENGVSQKGFDTRIISKEIENPWGITWLNNTTALVTHKLGKIYIVNDDHVTDTLSGLPVPYTKGQAGYLDIAAHPKYNENGWIYMTYAKPGDGGGSTTLVRFKINDNLVTDWEELYQTMPITDSSVHFGSRIIFDKNGYLYFSTGERGKKENAQDLTNDMGKIHRLRDDGQIPEDNPFYNTPNAKKSIWTYGNRNVQGLVYDESNDLIYATEHGPKGGDELNLIKKGANYGWPIITYGIGYDDSIISDIQEKEGMEQPIHYWVPSIATCGLMFYTGDQFPEWKNNIFSGALAKMHVARVVLKDGKYMEEEQLLKDVGRVRQVAQSPDGYIYVLTEGPGQIIKLTPKS